MRESVCACVYVCVSFLSLSRVRSLALTLPLFCGVFFIIYLIVGVCVCANVYAFLQNIHRERVFYLFSQSNANCQPTNTYVFVCDVSKRNRVAIIYTHIVL